MGGTESGIGIGKAFPVGEPAGTGDAQGVVRCAADGNGICRLMLVEVQRFRHSRGYSICSLGGVVESFGSHRCNVGEPALNLIGHC